MAANPTKLRQAAFVYLHVGILYEAAVYAMWRRGLLAREAEHVWLFLALGAGIVALVFWLLWFRHSVWTARIVWGLHALRLPSIIQHAFFPPAEQAVPAAFYGAALAVVLVNLAMLARAGWDL